MFAVISRSDPAAEVAGAGGSPLQRSRGLLDIAFSARGGMTYAARSFQQGALKVRFPNVARGTAPEAVIINTAGGLTGGDELDLKFSLDRGASATVASQACEKVYRSPGDVASISVGITLAPGSALDWLPQPAIFFDGAHLQRETHVSMARDARFLAVEGVIFGRAAMGERVTTGLLRDHWSIERGGHLVHADRFDTGDDIGATLAKRTVLGGNSAMATLRYIAPDAQARLEDMRALLATSPCPAAASAWDGMMVARFVAPDGYALNRELTRVLGAFRRVPMPRVWSI